MIFSSKYMYLIHFLSMQCKTVKKPQTFLLTKRLCSGRAPTVHIALLLCNAFCQKLHIESRTSVKDTIDVHTRLPRYFRKTYPNPQIFENLGVGRCLGIMLLALNRITGNSAKNKFPTRQSFWVACYIWPRATISSGWSLGSEPRRYITFFVKLI